MFKRVIYDNWSLIVPVVAFVFTSTIYFVMVIRAMLMKPDRRDQMAALPLEDGEGQSNTNASTDH